MLQIAEFKFLDGAEAEGTGNVYDNAQGSSLVVAVSGTFTATMKVQGQLGGEWYDLGVINVKNLETDDQIDEAGLFAVVGVDGCDQIRMNVTSYTSGTITAIGRVNF